MSILSTHNLTIGIESDGFDRHLLKNMSLNFSKSAIYQLYGGNGVGKTRLMETLSGIRLPLSGVIKKQGKPLYIAHQNGLKPWLTVEDSIRHCIRLFCDDAWTEKDFLFTLKQALDDLDLSDDQHTLIKHLSHGQQKKVGLARIWFDKRQLWLLDEPFSSLDSQSVKTVKKKLDAHTLIGGCIILTHHSTNLSLDTSHCPSTLSKNELGLDESHSINLHNFLPKNTIHPNYENE